MYMSFGSLSIQYRIFIVYGNFVHQVSVMLGGQRSSVCADMQDGIKWNAEQTDRWNLHTSISVYSRWTLLDRTLFENS